MIVGARPNQATIAKSAEQIFYTILGMESHAVHRQQRLIVRFLEGDWDAVPLPEHKPSSKRRAATYQASIELHFLRHSASLGLHRVFICNTNDEEVERDSWSADIDVDGSGQLLTAPNWSVEMCFEHKGRPVLAAEWVDGSTLIVTVWHTHLRARKRQFKLIRRDTSSHSGITSVTWRGRHLDLAAKPTSKP